MTLSLSRRHLLRVGGVVAGSLPFVGASAAVRTGPAPPVRLGWLGGTPPAMSGGVTWGTPWPQGAVSAGTGFGLQDDRGQALPLQTWPLAYWPDGSLKWTAHALAPQARVAGHYELRPDGTALPRVPGVQVAEEGADLLLDTGPLRCCIPRQGRTVIRSLSRAGRETLTDAHLVLQVAGDPDVAPAVRQRYRGDVQRVVVEQRGPVRAVIALHGSHRLEGGERLLLPFIVRIYAYAGADSLRIVHTLVFDGDAERDFISGLGLSFATPLEAPLHDRHVRFVGADGGVFREAVRGLSGLRRNPGDAILRAQLEGRATGPVAAFAPEVAERLELIPAFGSYRLLQAHPDGFQIHKRTAVGHSWLKAATGRRAAGVGYLGSPAGGVVFGIRNFWQSYPGQLDIEAADTAQGRITLWLWAPDAAPMDLRPYRATAGLDSHAVQREVLQITYEDPEPGFDSPCGVARTSELELHFPAATPSALDLQRLAQRIAEPPLLLATPARLHAAGVFGPAWSPEGAADSRARALDAQLAWYFDFYRDEVEQRSWYGFWDYGDVMHTYDEWRHVWRYDVGGYAWDNSELSTDLWLWYFFLRTGRADVFRLAEAMTRHTGEVDVHHLGRFAPLGSRHNVQHWGDSAKQLRISTAANRRFLYYLTADERIGDLLAEQVEALRTLHKVVPGRKVGQVADPRPGYASISFGTDWGAIAAAWLTAWERSGDPAIGRRLLTSMDSIAAQPHGFFTGVASMELASGRFERAPVQQLNVSHLSAVFGLAEICGELLQLLPSPAFERAWLDYCRLYNAPPAERQRVLGRPLGTLNLAQGHARLTAYAAYRRRDSALLQRAWQEFERGAGGIAHPNRRLRRLEPPEVLQPILEPESVSVIDEHAGTSADANFSTNAVAQWGLTALALLALDFHRR